MLKSHDRQMDRCVGAVGAAYRSYVVWTAMVWFVVTGLLAGPAAKTSRAEVTADQVRESIRLAVESLKSSQKTTRGTWPAYGTEKGGATALCTLALLSAGVETKDPHIQNGLRYLRKIGNPEATYATSLQTMVFCLAEPERDSENIRRNVRWLEEMQVKDGGGEGGWSYGKRRTQNPDNSNSQFALLALNEAQAVGEMVNPAVWERADKYWRTRQNKDGSWSYRSANGKGSMTCAGITSLIVTQRNLGMGDAREIDGKVVYCFPHEDDKQLQDALDWMGRNFSAKHNPSAQPAVQKTYLFYYLYALERVGRLSGQRFLGDHDWYREGAEFLVNDQNDVNGEWKGMFPPHITTAMALLFLSKGQRPVVISKLTHEPDGDWNRHRQDVGNLTRYIEQRWKKPMTWQVIDHSKASVEDLLQSPVLYLVGRDGLKMSAAEKKTFKEYVERGGFVFAEACCRGQRFDRDFRALMAELFPDKPLRLLPPDHPIWYAEEQIPNAYLRPLYGIDSCCRTSVVYCPKNLGCYWELARKDGANYSDRTRREMKAVLGIGANVVAYATNRRLRDKLDVPQVTIDESQEDQILRGVLRVAKLQHKGGSDDAPAALTNLLRATGTHLGARVDFSRILLPASEPTLPDFPAVFVHGRNDFTWSDTERGSIKKFVDNGGVIFGDAICASKEFAAAFEREIKSIFPDARWGRIPPTHAIFTQEFGGFDLSKVQLQKAPGRTATGTRTTDVQSVTPVLQGIEVDGRFVVIFSPNDISCALESSASSNCVGYQSDDAARLGINILLYALRQ